MREVVIIDDTFDELPKPNELSNEDWSTFFDDLDEPSTALLSDLYTGYSDAHVDDLKVSPAFVAVLWHNRTRLSRSAIVPLFQNYESTKATERRELDSLVERLEALGLACTTIGREIGETARGADLYFVDLFLGFRQFESDMDRAVQAIDDLIRDRAANPPLVVLMSRSPRLQQKRNDFRDRARLLGSTFRVISKAELAQRDRLEAMLTRLASHYRDSRRVAEFIHAWDTGLDRARSKFVGGLRRLDLSDIGQIRALLLDAEGQSLGEYLLDVADRVLQHEVESDASTINAAIELNRIDIAKYPAPHLEGTPDLQEFVHRMIFVNSERLRLSEDVGKVQLQFGDVLRWKAGETNAFGERVSLVVNPACDLVRRTAERVVLLSGTLEQLQPKEWSYRTDPVRTAIVILADGNRKWIRWNFKNVEALGWSELDTLIGEEGKLKRIGRLREAYAIEIQQRLLAHLGRIGRPADLPVPFRVAVSVFYVDSKRQARRLNVKEIESAACYVGRDEKSKPVHRLVLTEQTCDEVEQAVRALEDDAVHSFAKRSLAAIKADADFFARFERGEVEICPDKEKTSIKASDLQPCAEIVRGAKLEEGMPVTGGSARMALLLSVTVLPDQGVGEAETNS